jgi:hypothetical protein
MALIGEANSGAYSRADVDRKRKLAEMLMGDDFQAREPFGALAKALTGSRAGYENTQADIGERQGDQIMADLLKRKDWQGVMGSEWATPQNLAMASMLQGREWNQQDQQANWAREDARFAQQQAQPDWQTLESGGDVYRWNSKDPTATPGLFFDGPDAPKEPPRIEEQFDPATGLPTKKQWNPATGAWEEFGGVSAPKDPLVNVDVNNGGADDEFYKAAAKARGETFAGIEAAGIQAATKIGQINRLEQLLTGSPQGFEGGIKQLAGEFGIPTDGLDSIQSAQALINKMVPEQRTPGSGPMSDADLALFKQSLPRIINQPGGNDLIMQTLRGIAVYEQQTGEIASKVLNHEMTPAEGREAMKAIKNPLELFRASGGAAEAGAAPEGISPEEWAVMTPEERALWN